MIDNLLSAERTDTIFAEIVVGDTIHAAHTRFGLIGDVTVLDCLKALKAPDGEGITQCILAQYAGYAFSEQASRITGIPAEVDARVLSRKHNITASGLRQAMITQLETYLALPGQERVVFLERVHTSPRTNR